MVAVPMDQERAQSFEFQKLREKTQTFLSKVRASDGLGHGHGNSVIGVIATDSVNGQGSASSYQGSGGLPQTKLTAQPILIATEDSYPKWLRLISVKKFAEEGSKQGSAMAFPNGTMQKAPFNVIFENNAGTFKELADPNVTLTTSTGSGRESKVVRFAKTVALYLRMSNMVVSGEIHRYCWPDGSGTQDARPDDYGRFCSKLKEDR